MRTGYPARDIAGERLDWFTYDIEPDGTQICVIRTAGRSHDDLVLDPRTSQLLQVLLNEIAQDNTIPFPQARQAVLRALRRAHNRRRPTK
ncbi:MAG TPA: hypothetical protein VGF39_10410 [Stellaceae bacterium]|jgi:hypothetical protein